MAARNPMRTPWLGTHSDQEPEKELQGTMVSVNLGAPEGGGWRGRGRGKRGQPPKEKAAREDACQDQVKRAAVHV